MTRSESMEMASVTGGPQEYRGMNPEFVRRVWERRRIASAAKEEAARLATLAERNETAALELLGESREIRLFIARIATARDVEVAALVSEARHPKVATCRHAAIRAVKEIRPAWPSSRLGKLFQRDRTTVQHAMGQRKRERSRFPAQEEMEE